jgi:hypothetical protein
MLKIHDLEEKLLETQLQLERVTDEKLTHMMSIQKSPIGKSGLGFVACSSDIPSTSRIVFVKPTVSEPPTTIKDKKEEVIGGDIPATAEATQKFPTIRRPLICHHCGLSGHIKSQCSLLKAQRSQVKKELPRQATCGTRPLAWHQAPQHQRHQQRFVLANQNGKPKTNKSRHYMKKAQKLEDDQFYRELPIWMQSMIRCEK